MKRFFISRFHFALRIAWTITVLFVCFTVILDTSPNIIVVGTLTCMVKLGNFLFGNRTFKFLLYYRTQEIFSAANKVPWCFGWRGLRQRRTAGTRQAVCSKAGWKVEAQTGFRWWGVQPPKGECSSLWKTFHMAIQFPPLLRTQLGPWECP